MDVLLIDLGQKFPPKFVQQKSGEKPVPVEQFKKEVEPVLKTESWGEGAQEECPADSEHKWSPLEVSKAAVCAGCQAAAGF